MFPFQNLIINLNIKKADFYEANEQNFALDLMHLNCYL